MMINKKKEARAEEPAGGKGAEVAEVADTAEMSKEQNQSEGRKQMLARLANDFTLGQV